MEVTLEQVERLREKANVSYARAKEALQCSGGNLLDALIYLEEQGDIPRPEGGSYSTRGQAVPEVEEQPEPQQGEEKNGKFNLMHLLRRLRFLLLDNDLEIWRKDQPVTAVPVLILILLVLVAAYIVLPLLILGLFLGFRYRFSGPDLERESINNVMGSVADTAADLGRQVMNELRSQSRNSPQTGQQAPKTQSEQRETDRKVREVEQQMDELDRRMAEDPLLGGAGNRKDPD